MMLWIFIAFLAAVAAWGLVAPFFARRPPQSSDTGAIEVLGAQLAGVDAEVAAGRLDPAQGETMRAEISRRLLAEGPTPATGPPSRPVPPWAGVATAGGVALAAIGLYSAVGRPDLVGAPAGPASTPAPAADGDFVALVGQLQAKMRAEPGDPKGWRLLGWSLTRLGRFGEAASAYGRAAALEPASAEDRSAQGEALTQAGGGRVGGEAATAFRAALARDRADPRARFYLALAQDQAGDHAAALAAWAALLEDAPPDAPWFADVRAAVARIAARDGEAIAGRLPPPRDEGGVGQGEAIAAMVDRLAARLKAEPRDADGWVRLMRARMVLGQADKAHAALGDGLAAFADSPARQAGLREAGRALNVPGA